MTKALNLNLQPAKVGGGRRLGDLLMADIRRTDIEEWKDGVRTQIEAKDILPTTANGRLSILLSIIRAYVAEYQIDRDPTKGVEPFDESSHRTYTKEQPNALLPEQVDRWLGGMFRLAPQHFAITCLGFYTGWRPSSLRALRRKGPECDIDWESGILLNRRSHTGGATIQNRTKTGLDGEVPLDGEILKILHWHIERLPEGPMKDSDLLFPAADGGPLRTNAVWRAFRKVAKGIGLEIKLSPRGMRRTSKDLLRRAGAPREVAKAIHGHITDEMHELYSTVGTDEARAHLAKVSQMVDFNRSLEKSGGECGGEALAVEGREATSATGR